MISQVITFLFDLNHKHPSALGPVFQRKVPLTPRGRNDLSLIGVSWIKVKIETSRRLSPNPHQALSPRFSPATWTLACSLPSARLRHHSPSRLSPHGCHPRSSLQQGSPTEFKGPTGRYAFSGKLIASLRHLEHIRPHPRWRRPQRGPLPIEHALN